MVVVESIEGHDGPFWFHYDVTNDVLYVRLNAMREVTVCGEETDDGLVLLRAVSDDSVAGVTVVNWWKRFGRGVFPDSVRQIASEIGPWAERVRTAA